MGVEVEVEVVEVEVEVAVTTRDVAPETESVQEDSELQAMTAHPSLLPNVHSCLFCFCFCLYLSRSVLGLIERYLILKL